MSTNDSLTCSRCHHPVSPNANSCWRCGGQLPSTSNQKADQTFEFSEATSPHSPVHSTAANQSTFQISSLMLITTLIAACLAMILAVPGLGIILTICSLPPLIRTVILVRRRVKTGLPVEAGSKVVWFLGSLGTTILITFVTCCLSFAAFFGSCLVMLPIADRGGDIEPLFVIAIAASLIAAGLVLWLFSFWMRARWRRDTTA
ncbi:MAG: hypothetical protein ABL888_21070 [Pirellulaceae bacterium]|jgi:hypothetical protein